MATKDYARQGRPAPRRHPQHAEPPRSKRHLWVGLVLALGAIGAFGYFLYTINGAAEKAPKATTASKPATKTASLPPKPVPKWQYEKDLKEKEVVVDVPEQPESTRQYRLQCGSFRTQSQADSLKARIAFQGMESTLKRVTGSKGTWYQVILGPFERKRLAEASRHKLARAKINHCKIYYWQ